MKPIKTNLGSYEIGDRFYGEPYEHSEGGMIFYGIEKQGYPLTRIVDSLELIEETDKPREYYTPPRS